MISSLFHTLLVHPLYNALILLIELPYVDAGVAVILLTIIVKVILFPLSKKAMRTQYAMRGIQEPLKELQERHKDDRQALAMATMQLYRDKGINPFSSLFLLLIQIPIVLALYWVFAKGGLPVVNLDALYSFVPNPGVIDVTFLNLFDITKSNNLWLAALTGITSYYQAVTTLPELEQGPKFGESMKHDLTRSMHVQMKCVLPFVIFFIAFTLQPVISLYWITSNCFAIAQHLHLNRILGRNSKE
jgi:YidC/Oxa1 family membrane protein insertase